MSIFKDLIESGKSLITGMEVTAENFGKEPITRHYPLDKPTPPPGSRGVLRMVDFFEEDTTLHKTDFYPGAKHAPCIRGCPANTDARGYVSHAGEGNFTDGYTTLKMTYPFSGTLGRVCPAPCEDLCTRGVAGPEPIAIRRLKRFYDDWEQLLPAEERVHYKDRMKPLNGKKAAIIGTGPAGLQVAFELALEGWEVTMFERCPIPMGYVSLTIPRFRLEHVVWQREVQAIQDTGRVAIKYGVNVGKDIKFEDIKNEFGTVVIAAGATKPIDLRIPGEDGPGVYKGEPWLEDVKLKAQPDLRGKNVVIVGGGSTSTDCGRSALRCGAKAVITYRRTRAEMPASPLEVEDALEEGVDIQFLVSPLEVLRDAQGNVRALKAQRTRLGPRDAKGKRSPVPIPGSEFELPADIVITSLGRGGALDWLPAEIKRNRSGLCEVNHETNETTMPDVYAVGDSMMVSTIIQAIAYGKRAATAIIKKAGQMKKRKDLWDTNGFTPALLHDHPKGWGKVNADNSINTDRKKPVIKPKEQNFPLEHERPCIDSDQMFGEKWRHDKVFKNHLYKTPMVMQGVEERLGNWNECEQGFTLEEAVTEGRRCLSCESEVCISCGICVDACPDEVIYLNAKEVKDQKDVVWADVYSIDLSRCCYCGLCTEACPTKSLVMTPDYEFSYYNKAENTITKDWMRIGFK